MDLIRLNQIFEDVSSLNRIGYNVEFYYLDNIITVSFITDFVDRVLIKDAIYYFNQLNPKNIYYDIMVVNEKIKLSFHITICED